MKRIRGFSLAKTAESLPKNGKRAPLLMAQRKYFSFWRFHKLNLDDCCFYDYILITYGGVPVSTELGNLVLQVGLKVP